MDIYWDTQNQALVKSLTGGSVSKLSWALRDKISITLNYLQQQSGDLNVPYVRADIPAGTAIRFGVKPEGDLDATTFLVYQPTWTKSDTGIYTADVDLNTSELIAAVGETTTDVVGEFTIERTADGSHTGTTQFTLEVYPDVIRNTEAGPVSISTLLVPFTDEYGVNCVRLMNQDGETLEIFKPAGATL